MNSDQFDKRDLWVSMGIHRSDDGTTLASSFRKRRMSKHRESLEMTTQNIDNLAPGARVMFLLQEKDEVPTLFTEMGELIRSNDNIEEWKETARWVKFEEVVEKGGNRWSKPHVATLSLHALFQLRNCLLNDVVLIDLEVESLPHLIERILDELIKSGIVKETERDDIRYTLTRRHTHQYEQPRNGGNPGSTGKESGFLNAVRSISDIGRSFSHGKNLQKIDTSDSNSPKKMLSNHLELPKVEIMPKDMQKESSQIDIGRNTHFMKKLPSGAEASNILIGEVNYLPRTITAFVRLSKASILGDFTEVPIPTRFLFLLLGPRGDLPQYREIGRAMATLMSDEIFHEVAYKARNRTDLIDGIDEFLDSVTVLPPGEWDPNIRIEPPTVIPSQQKRVQIPAQYLNPNLNKSQCAELEKLDEEGHGNDPALQRTGRLFGGLIADVKRKLPFYKSEFTDAFNLQCIASFCFMYFALLAPIVTFGGLLEEATHQRMAAMENLASAAICGVIYHLFSGQSLTIIGSTGPVLVFETIVFDICVSMNLQYLSFRFWVHIWTALILFIMVVTDASSLVSYITRFTEESFATLIAIIFIYEALVKLKNILNGLNVIEFPSLPNYAACHCVDGGASIDKVVFTARKLRLEHIIPTNSTSIDYSKFSLRNCRRFSGHLEGDNCFIMYDRFLMSLILMFSTFLIAIILKRMRNSCYFPSRVRQLFSDFAVMIAIFFMTLVDFFVGIDTPKLNVPSTFRPTWEGRGWFIPLFNGNPLWTAFLAMIPALLACILIFMDQQITTVIVNRKENKLKKGCGYHLDLFVLSILIIIVGALGLPVYVAATVLSINHVNSLKLESESRAPGEVAHFVGVCEQRLTGIVTFFLIGLSVTMTKLLSHIPMPVLYGVFLYMGISALGGIQLFDRILLLLMPMKYQPDTIYIRHVPINVIHKFTMCQVGCLAVLWVVKSIKKTSIAFPIMLVAMVAVRKVMEQFFNEKDLKYLDDKMPDFHLRRKEDLKKKNKTEEIEIDLDENQGTIHAVKTEAHLHIYSDASGAPGNIIKIPLSAINESSHNINISREVNSSGMWKHISSESKTSLHNFMNASVTAINNDSQSSPRLASPEEDDEAITINILKSTTETPSTNEHHPLL